MLLAEGEAPWSVFALDGLVQALISQPGAPYSVFRTSAAC